MEISICAKINRKEKKMLIKKERLNRKCRAREEIHKIGKNKRIQNRITTRQPKMINQARSNNY